MKTYSGDPYTGFIEVRIEPPDGDGWTRYGRASAHFSDIKDGRAKLVVFGAIDDEQGDAGFAVDGTYDETGWSSETGHVSLRLDEKGAIEGGGTLPPRVFQFSGSASESIFDLDVRLELTEATPNGLPAGTTFLFAYDLSRGAPKERTASTQDSDRKRDWKGTCRKIRYEMRPVANIGEGTMSMIQVPICIQ